MTRPSLSQALGASRSIAWRQRTGRPCHHLFEPADVEAVDAALAARRPLLVLGEPGLGKTQLAAAAAHALSRPFVSWTADARTRPGDLLYRIDDVERLAQAQLARAPANGNKPASASSLLVDAESFTLPGPLWWCLDWKGASKLRLVEESHEHLMPDGLEHWTEGAGVVGLLDELDKAEPDVPNSLLEVLGNERFRGPHGVVDRDGDDQAAPLIFVTSNDERDLPDAFLRRCLVHVLSFPDDIVGYLTNRGRLHFAELHTDVVQAAAEDLVHDRDEAGTGPRPGLAEYLDLLTVLDGIRDDWSGDVESLRDHQLDQLRRLRRYVFQKYSRMRAARQASRR